MVANTRHKQKTPNKHGYGISSCNHFTWNMQVTW